MIKSSKLQALKNNRDDETDMYDRPAVTTLNFQLVRESNKNATQVRNSLGKVRNQRMLKTQKM